jgi:hypothetical protein
MKSLSPRAKAALAQYRSEHALPADARERARRTLGARLAAGQAGSVTSADLAPPRLPPGRNPRLLRWGVVGGIGGFALLGGLLVGSSWLQSSSVPAAAAPASAALALAVPPQHAVDASEHAVAIPLDPAPTEAASASSLHATRERIAPPPRRRAAPQTAPTPVVRPALASDPVSQPAVQAEEPEQVQPESPSATRWAPSSTSSVTRTQAALSAPPAEPDRSLDAEVALLRTAHEQLRVGQPLRALSALSQHAERFPRGELLEMRKVTRVMALCALDKVTAARAEAESFLLQHASSGYAAKVRQLCAPATSAAPLSTQSR